MMFKRIFLMSPPSSSRYGGLRAPAGIGHIAQALQDKKTRYEYMDMRLGYGFKQLKNALLAFEPDLVGVSMITLEYKNTYRMISKIKRILPTARVVAGGHHVTILKQTVLE
ncbi:MAG: cobalamin-dependent protein, partial [Candidatus Aminicenantales bacterium]